MFLRLRNFHVPFTLGSSGSVKYEPNAAKPTAARHLTTRHKQTPFSSFWGPVGGLFASDLDIRELFLDNFLDSIRTGDGCLARPSG
jgi:hypothetical protein